MGYIISAVKQLRNVQTNQKNMANSKVILYTYRPCEDSFIVQDLDILCKKVPIHKLKLLRRINKFLSIISSKTFVNLNAKAVAKNATWSFNRGISILYQDTF